jgi:transposase
MDRGNVALAKKNARRQRAWILFQDESGISERPPVRRTWAPKGETPILIHAFNWKKMSICGAIAYRWDGRRCRLFFQMKPGSYDANSLIHFFKHLKRHFRGQRIILVWDGLPAHRSQIMSEYLRRQVRWLKVERLPGYAPDLNPIETLWGNVKGRELANLCAKDLGDAASAFRRGLARVRRTRSLPFAFLQHAGLSF